MRLQVLYRTHPGSNTKSRPSWFDRRAAWESLTASLAAVEHSAVTVVVDGGLPRELVEAIGREHRQVTVRGGRASTSFRCALAVGREISRTAPDDTLVWFAEDDYLYRPDAMPSLVAAVGALPDVDYFTLFTPDDSAWHASHPSQPDHRVPALPGGPVHAGGHRWQRIAKTTSTFGVRARALRSDRWLLDLGSRVGAPFDTATWHALQRLRPFPWRHLLSDLDPAASRRGTAKVVAKPAMRAVLNTAGLVSRPRVLVAPVDDLAVHMEVEHLSGGTDWAALARQVETAHGLGPHQGG
ncbi:hypothetical protein [Blastococcus sp. TF02A-26]|uniref:hypothetical protein n=1 Tax=Blastococcus sp. TF02A-26 TaxID=2250577 RepID=UPI000DEBBD33|nr:hypothetical protein [Blastococcus sp. TF02A-26]RBY87387.1 hypothetical protein DQ240_07290 [Blastococcus sp. TF02A-26]